MANDTKDRQATEFDVSESTGLDPKQSAKFQGSAPQGTAHAGNGEGAGEQQRGEASVPQGPDAQADPRHHTANIKRMLQELRDHLREDTAKVSDPKAQALFETTAEVVQGLMNAYDHYENKSEPAMR